jgi:hypothetical protein
LSADSNPKFLRIGGTDKTQEGLWRWTDGSDWDYEGWGSGEPNGKPENGNSFGYKKDKNEADKRAWFDVGTVVRFPFLCASDKCPGREFVAFGCFYYCIACILKTCLSLFIRADNP